VDHDARADADAATLGVLGVQQALRLTRGATQRADVRN